jgi:hypothetical protein
MRVLSCLRRYARTLALTAFVLGTLQAALAAEVALPGTSLRFDAPDHYTPLTKAEIGQKYPASNRPRFVTGNEGRTTTIAFDLRSVSMTEQQLETQVDQLHAGFARTIPGYKPIERGLKTFGGRTWAYFELTSSAIDTDIHNIIVMTPYRGGLMIMNFNSTRSEFKTAEAELRHSLASIRFVE